MLEQMRRQGASIFVYLIFCLLIVIFVINFRPGQSRQNDNGCRGTSNSVIEVDGVAATQNAFKVALVGQRRLTRGENLTAQQRTEIAMELLIRREILAQAAEARGLTVSDDLMIDEIKKGRFYIAGLTGAIDGIFDDPTAADRHWQGQAFDGWLNLMTLSRNAYIEEQKRSLLAAMMADVLRESVQVSRDEALQGFLFDGNTATYDVVAFHPAAYESAMQVSDADVDRFAAAHADEIAARYKADERTYKGTKAALRLRQIFIAKKGDDPKSPGMAIDDAKAKLEIVRAAGKDKFAAAAKDLSTDPAAKASGGALGWHSADLAGLGDKALSDAVKTLKPGDMTPVIATDRGAYLILAEDKRAGDLTLDQVKHEIAESMARETWGKEAAKRAALAALDKARAGTGQNLDQMFKHGEEPAPSGVDMEQLQQLFNDPNMTPEQKQQLLQMMQKHAAPGGAHGEITVEGKDQPAGWFEDDSGAAPGSAAPAAGSAAPAPAVPAAPAAPVEVVASKDVLPPMSDVAAPTVDHFGPTPRQHELPGIGPSREAATAIFDELQPGNLAKKVYESKGDYIVVQLIARQQPNVADFDKDADRRVDDLRRARSAVFVDSWLADKCQALAKAGKIVPASDKLLEREDDGKVVKSSYQPCFTLHGH